MGSDQEQLSKALRANLLRRKQQMKERRELDNDQFIQEDGLEGKQNDRGS